MTTTITISDEQKSLLCRLLHGEQIKSRRLAEKAKESIEYCDLRGRYSGFAEMRQQKHEQAERSVAELLSLISNSCHTP